MHQNTRVAVCLDVKVVTAGGRFSHNNRTVGIVLGNMIQLLYEVMMQYFLLNLRKKFFDFNFKFALGVPCLRSVLFQIITLQVKSKIARRGLKQRAT